MKLLKIVAALCLATVATTCMAQDMSFFVTSVQPNGGNLGGLAGADGYCEGLAAIMGAG